MVEKDPGKFARRAQRILHREQPTSLADLMAEDTRKTGNTESRETGDTGNQKSGYPEHQKSGPSGTAVREEFRLPEELAETLREYAHQQRMKKTAVVIEALQEFFRQRNFPPPLR